MLTCTWGNKAITGLGDPGALKEMSSALLMMPVLVFCVAAGPVAVTAQVSSEGSFFALFISPLGSAVWSLTLLGSRR